MSEFRYCRKCLQRTEHEILEDPDPNSRRGRGLYTCTACGLKGWKRHLRPSAESSY